MSRRDTGAFEEELPDPALSALGVNHEVEIARGCVERIAVLEALVPERRAAYRRRERVALKDVAGRPAAELLVVVDPSIGVCRGLDEGVSRRLVREARADVEAGIQR